MISSTHQRDRLHRRQGSHSGFMDNFVMSDDLITQIQQYLESWRQITHFVGLARIKRFGATEEDQFLELKGIIAQELEMIWASGESSCPNREDVLEMMNNAPSIRYLSQLNEGALRNVENQWHQIYIRWHATLGHLKAKNTGTESHPGWTDFLRKKLAG